VARDFVTLRRDLPDDAAVLERDLPEDEERRFDIVDPSRVSTRSTLASTRLSRETPAFPFVAF